MSLLHVTGSYEPGKYLGCFRDNPAQRDVGNVAFTLRADNSPQRCLEICINGGMYFFSTFLNYKSFFLYFAVTQVVTQLVVMPSKSLYANVRPCLVIP